MSFFERQEELARQLARMPIGNSSRAAVRELDALRAAGYDTVIWSDGKGWNVVDRPTRLGTAWAMIRFWLATILP